MNVDTLPCRLADAAAVQVVPLFCAVGILEPQGVDARRLVVETACQHTGAIGRFDVGAERWDKHAAALLHDTPLVMALQDMLTHSLGVLQPGKRAGERIAVLGRAVDIHRGHHPARAALRNVSAARHGNEIRLQKKGHR